MDFGVTVVDGVDGTEFLACGGGDEFGAAAGVADGGFQDAALDGFWVGDGEAEGEAGLGIGGGDGGEDAAQMGGVKGEAQAQTVLHAVSAEDVFACLVVAFDTHVEGVGFELVGGEFGLGE